jgi:hypothetical protein
MSSLVSQVFVFKFVLGTVLCNENGTKSLAATVPEQVVAILHYDSHHCCTRRRSELCLERLVCVMSCFLFRRCEGQPCSWM